MEPFSDAACQAAKWIKSSASRLSEKGYEQGSEGGFGRYEEDETGQKEPSRRSLGLRHGSFRSFSDSLRRLILRSSQARRSRKFPEYPFHALE